ncbi:MAG: hypothetical protein SPJ27_02595 [Candidatus Onthovivens sp.]|nr:hypothetical protein [Candidatus Onthovivens sp.]
MPDISKIKIGNNTYEIKDNEVRDILNILLGNKSNSTSVETE